MASPLDEPAVRHDAHADAWESVDASREAVQWVDSDRAERRALLRSALIATALPAAIVAVDQVLKLATRGFGPSTYLPFYGWAVAKTALLGWCVGRYVRPTYLRWVILAWALILMDLSAFAVEFDTRSGLQHTLLLAQVGLLIVWAVLGQTPWVWRLPAGIVACAALLLVCGWMIDSYQHRGWPSLILLTAFAQAAVCVVLRTQGFQLAQPDAAQASREGGHAAQFGTKHLLVWATALGPALAALTTADAMRWLNFENAHLSQTIVLALCLALLNIVTLWIATGRGSVVVKTGACIATPLIVGVCAETLAVIAKQYAPRARGGWWPRNGVDELLVSHSGEWIAWAALAMGLFAGLLLFFRSSGYRLVRPAAGNAQ